jgi:hypothetical protein
MIISDSGNLPWWQVATGLLAIPTALFGLAYTYRLYQKTQLESRELRLKIIERERQLGLAEILGLAETLLPEFELVDAEPKSERGVGRRLFLGWWQAAWWLGLLLLALAPRPSPHPITRGAILGSIIISVAVGSVLVWLLGRRQGYGEAWILAAVFTAAIILSILGWFVYLYLSATRIVDIPIEGRAQQFVIGDNLTQAALRFYCSNLEHPSAAPGGMLLDFGLDVDRVWTNSSVVFNSVFLLVAYNLALLATIVSILSGAQLISLLKKARSTSLVRAA